MSYTDKTNKKNTYIQPLWLRSQWISEKINKIEIILRIQAVCTVEAELGYPDPGPFIISVM